MVGGGAGASYLNSKLLSWVDGGCFNSVVRLKLSQPSLGGVVAGAELGQMFFWMLNKYCDIS